MTCNVKILVLILLSMVIGAAVMYLAIYLYSINQKKKKKKEKVEKIGTLNLCLIVVCLILVLFTVSMIIIYCFKGSTPDVLIGCVFTVCGTECGALAWIKTAKEKYKSKGDGNIDYTDIQYDYDDETNG